MSESNIVIYTDGGCRKNPGIGGWGALLIYNGNKKEIKGSSLETTNNRMELTAVIEALKIIKKKIPITLYTDSQYVFYGITKWYYAWQKKNWKNVKNIDLWHNLVSLTVKHQITWHWVRGHSNNEGNIYVDKLANIAMDELEKKVKR